MTAATINRHIALIGGALEGLGAPAPAADVERLAMLVQHAMDHGRRTYHVSAHVFDVCSGLGPRQVLAGLFHDTVYYQLDGGFPRDTERYLETLVEPAQGGLRLRAAASTDPGASLCAEVFGFAPGGLLPLFGGMNEFLSACVAVHTLGPYVPPLELLAIAACIEATVPFRGPDPERADPPQRLFRRLREAGATRRLGLDEGAVRRLVADAVELANRDVRGFAEPDPAEFLATSWDLIEESNAQLASPGVYTLREYRSALSRMEAFLGGLDPDHVFHHFEGAPAPEVYERLRDGARSNLTFATRYLGAKLLTVGLVEALALLTGGDCPVAMLVGDIRSRDGKPDRAEDYLPPSRDGGPVDPRLLRVLELGRARESRADLTASPLTAFVVRWLGEAGAARALEPARAFFTGAVTARDFLRSLDPELVRAMATACARIAVSRQGALLSLAASP